MTRRTRGPAAASQSAGAADGLTDVQRHEALLEAGALQDAILNSANFSSIATDARGVIQIFNVGAERMLGYTAAEVSNKITPADISDPDEIVARAEAMSVELGTPIAPGFEALVYKASRGIEDIYELTYLCKDGRRLPAVVSVSALRDDRGALVGYLLIGTDNTARKQVEEEQKKLDQALRQKNVELESARLVADKANLAKSEFLSSMSHELRSPLNAILGFAQLLDSANPPPTATQKRSIGQILRAGWYLLQLISEVLDLAVIESGKVSLSVEPVSLAEVLLECRAMVQQQAEDRGTQLHFPQFAAPRFVFADRVRLKQIIINLLSNAIKYSHPRSAVVLDVSTSAPDRTRIGVRDHGPGLSADQLAQLFQPFNRLGREKTSEEGTGIGLVVSKLLVELMGGVINAESTSGVGSYFWFELGSSGGPMLAVDDARGVAVLTRAKKVRPGAILRTLLYVEDNTANMALVEELIGRRSDLRMLTATNGIDGIVLARNHQPDVILMDLNLPGISGTQTLELLLAEPTTAHIPVLAISANAMKRDIARGMEAGFFRYLTKPINVDVFMDAVDDALEFAAGTMRGKDS